MEEGFRERAAEGRSSCSPSRRPASCSSPRRDATRSRRHASSPRRLGDRQARGRGPDREPGPPLVRHRAPSGPSRPGRVAARADEPADADADAATARLAAPLRQPGRLQRVRRAGAEPPRDGAGRGSGPPRSPTSRTSPTTSTTSTRWPRSAQLLLSPPLALGLFPGRRVAFAAGSACTKGHAVDAGGTMTLEPTHPRRRRRLLGPGPGAGRLRRPRPEVVEVTRGQDVRDAVAEHEPDLVILDMQIGNMGGIAVAIDLRLEESVKAGSPRLRSCCCSTARPTSSWPPEPTWTGCWSSRSTRVASGVP